MMKLLVTDLDNTLYDWVGFFAKAFEAMADALAEHLGEPLDRLLTEFKAVHQRYGNSEHPFAVLDLPSVQRRYSRLSRAEMSRELDEVFHAFNTARREHLSLYDGVEETLRQLSAQGVALVAHTEAVVENAYYRLAKLDVAQYFLRLYALEGEAVDHPEPARAAALAPPEGFVHVLPPTERKPNPGLLLDICKQEGVNPSDCWYIGDSLVRDVYMAKTAGCVAIWARYGTAVDPQDWETLVRVTHWTPEAVARDEKLRLEAAGVQPTHVVNAFDELLRLHDREMADGGATSRRGRRRA